MYRYMEDLEVTKHWFQGNIDHILDIYGKDHSLTKEDVYLGAFASVLELAVAFSRMSPIRCVLFSYWYS